MRKVFLVFWVFMGCLFADINDDVFLKLDTGGHTDRINDIITIDSGEIVSASNDKTIRVWDAKNLGV